MARSPRSKPARKAAPKPPAKAQAKRPAPPKSTHAKDEHGNPAGGPLPANYVQ